MSREKNKNQKGRVGLVEYLAIKTELPADILSGDFRIEIRGRNTLFMHGCRRIIKYAPDEMIMAAKGFEVSIVGERLICTTYHEGTVTVEGYIKSVDFDCESREGDR